VLGHVGAQSEVPSAYHRAVIIDGQRHPLGKEDFALVVMKAFDPAEYRVSIYPVSETAAPVPAAGTGLVDLRVGRFFRETRGKVRRNAAARGRGTPRWGGERAGNEE
jgi:hypothetical protein